MTSPLRLLILAGSVLAGSCAATRISGPVAALPMAEHAFSQNEIASATPVASKWWRIFEDPQLDRLVAQSLNANADLRMAFANLANARAKISQAEAARMPQPTIESSAAVDNPSRQPSAANVSTTDYDLAATISWDADLFGRLRASTLAARADALAQAAALDGVRVAVVADTVLAYVDLCAATHNGEIAKSIVATQERNVKGVRDQLAAGEVSPLELSQAAGLLETSRAILPTFDAAGANARYRLATLQGLPPTDHAFDTITCRNLPRVKGMLSIGDGAALLGRRPDIREAENRLAAAKIKIGIARADLYPRINLGGALGLLAGGFSASASPLISWAFPNQAPVRAKIAQARADERAALASFDNAVLRALREVETGLAALQAESARNAALSQSLEQAALYARRTSARARVGDISPLLRLDAERTWAMAALQKGQSDHAVAQGYVTLFRALGGGWQDAPEPLDPSRPIS